MPFLLACSSDRESASAPTETPSPTPAATTALTLPTPTPTPAISLTPRAITADLVSARRLESEGDLIAAGEAYIATAATVPPSRSEAVLGAARLLLENDQP